jgi:hypothetical protein
MPIVRQHSKELRKGIKNIISAIVTAKTAGGSQGRRLSKQSAPNSDLMIYRLSRLFALTDF